MTVSHFLLIAALVPTAIAALGLVLSAISDRAMLGLLSLGVALLILSMLFA